MPRSFLSKNAFFLTVALDTNMAMYMTMAMGMARASSLLGIGQCLYIDLSRGVQENTTFRLWSSRGLKISMQRPRAEHLDNISKIYMSLDNTDNSFSPIS